ncbi:MAG TPA: helix-turn-helix transcriptional regulator [Candidatus Stercoripulliclostridium merdipullorum]|uniref:Helix-turn-helix transcriptional regulator n=1 Tax=Candidatus Stercoripulliclostridium merdipullorum TaxID=2840952 RepID=A0A9D1SYD7_9FIRM|nr:helix-turn-helix transcriptional regulator [Candidatus Stercoripulliclostridium merdipullorum]
MIPYVCTRIRELRLEAGLSQEAFGKLLFVSQDTVSLWENGRSLPGVEYIIKICNLFQVSADDLLGLKPY